MTVDPRGPIALASARRFDHSYACDASALPSGAGWRLALRARNPLLFPVSMPSASLLPLPLATRSMPGRIPQNPAASSAAVPLPASPRPCPECNSCCIYRPDPHPPLDGRDWDEAHSPYPPLLRSLVQVLDPASQSASSTVRPAPLWHPAEPGRGPLSASSFVHASFANCYSFSRVDLLIVPIAPLSALITGSLTQSVIGIDLLIPSSRLRDFATSRLQRIYRRPDEFCPDRRDHAPIG